MLTRSLVGGIASVDGAAATGDPRPHAVVIGSGFGGLAAAVRLGARGYRVTVLEQLRHARRPRARASSGRLRRSTPARPSSPRRSCSRSCGRSPASGWATTIDLRPVSPFYRVRFDDGEHFEYSGDADAMSAEVARLTKDSYPDDVDGYERFLAASEAIYRVGFEALGDEPFDAWTDMAKVLPDLVRLEAYRTVWSLACKHVRDPRLRIVLTFQSLLVGGNPFATTSVYCLIAFLERRWGVHFPIGGTGRLVQRPRRPRSTGRAGAVRCGAEVAQITRRPAARATGVRLADGETLAADVVVSNCDSAWTYRHLLAPEHRHRWTNRRIERSRYSMSLFVWYFGTNRRYDDVAHHTIVLGPRYRELLGDIFDRQHLAEDFSLYLHRPTATDPSLAPAGCDAFYVLSPVPHLGSGTDWRAAAEPYRRAIEARLEATLLPGLGDVDRHVADDDAAGLPGRPVVVPRRRVRPRAGADAERVVPAAQPQRGGRPPLPRRRRHASGRRACRACCRRPASSTRSCRTPTRCGPPR